ncbi:hypothetical protein N7486_003209 [Penicillium sp. IBT 16267x]|nr:hypothetical protein N7486_003209 [Penicillium sp. IBT 16267x]
MEPVLEASDYKHRTKPQIVQNLIKKGPEVNLILSSGRYESALAAATFRGQIHIVEILFQKGAHVNITNHGGHVPTENATLDGQNDLAGVRLQANPQSAMGRTPLFFAARNGHTQMVELLLTNRASPNIKDYYRSNAIFEAVGNGRVGVVKCSLKFQDGMDFEDVFGRSLFWWARWSMFGPP